MASPETRLKRRAQFLAAARGAKAPMPGLVLQALRRDDALPARLGFTVTKKVGNAVVRNRTRRRLREAARLLLRDRAASGAPVLGVDLVLIGRDGTRSRPFPALLDDLARALKRTGASQPSSPPPNPLPDPLPGASPDPALVAPFGAPPRAQSGAASGAQPGASSALPDRAP